MTVKTKICYSELLFRNLNYKLGFERRRIYNLHRGDHLTLAARLEDQPTQLARRRWHRQGKITMKKVPQSEYPAFLFFNSPVRKIGKDIHKISILLVLFLVLLPAKSSQIFAFFVVLKF